MADHFTYPLSDLPSAYDGVAIGLTGLNIVDLSTGLLGLQGLIAAQFDPYIFVRSSYLQHRQALVDDGKVPRSPLEPATTIDVPAAEATEPAN